jgi:hypothetical protein
VRPFRISKFNAVRTNGYASKREAQYAAELEMRKRATNGDVLSWLEQVPIKLPGCKYVVDFLVFKRDGSWELVEVKGAETDTWRAKVRALQETRPELFAKLVIVR